MSILKTYSLSTNKKNPLLFFWSIDKALTAISWRGGSPFCPLSRSTSNSMWEYANKPKTYMHECDSSFIWLCSAVFYQRHCIFQQPIFWAPGQQGPSRDTGLATIPVCFWIVSKKFHSKRTNEKKTTPIKTLSWCYMSHNPRVCGNSARCVFI